MCSPRAAQSDVPAPTQLARLVGRAAVAEAESWVRGIPGHRFGLFGRALGVRAAIRGEGLQGGALVLTPVNSVRYWEFDFADRHLRPGGGRALDVSSPRLFSMYLAHRRRFDTVVVANPDESDLSSTRRLVEACGLSRIETLAGDVGAVTASKFAAVWSISVVEHIPGERGDAEAVQAMFQALEPGGVLVITVPTDREAWDEVRSTDTYDLGASPDELGQYFFQRFYDKASIRERIIAAIGIEPSATEWFGEIRPGTFHAYVANWLTRGFEATVQDPAFIARNFKVFGDWEAMPGMGVCGMTFHAPRTGVTTSAVGASRHDDADRVAR